MSLDLVVLSLVAVFGLCFGSFFNVVILRGLSGESIVFPGSKCPKCGNSLKWWQNIPVISYLLLRGKCGFCKEKISIQYPIIELVTMCIFIVTYLRWGIDCKTLFITGYFSLFLITAVTDLKERVILTRHAYFLAGLGLIYAILGGGNPDYIINEGQNPVIMSIVGVLVGVVVMELLARVGYLLAGQRAFGEGDSYIAGALGAILGAKYILWVLLAGFVIQFIVSLPLFLFNLIKTERAKVALELILFLALAGLMWFYGQTLGETIYFCAVGLLVIMALHLAQNILTNIKTPSNVTYLPYVPALVIAAIAVIWQIY